MNPVQKIPKPNYKETITSLQKFTQTKQAKSFTWLSLTLFTISFFIIMAIKPTFITIAKLTREIKEKREANRNLTEKVKALVAAQAIFVKNSGNLTLLDEAFPKKNEFASLAFFFEQKAQIANVAIRSLNFDELSIGKDSDQNSKKEDLDIPSFAFAITVAGEYLNLKGFLESLETSPRIVFINTSSINPTKNKVGVEIISEISLSITGKVFFEQK